jgi:uncharacterized protein
MRGNYFLVLSLLLGTTVDAQIPYVNSGEVISAGIKLYDNGEYKKALEQYRQVNESDTNYTLALYEQVLTLNADSSFEAAKQLALEGLKLPKSDRRQLLLALGASYDYLGKSDSALQLFESMTQMYPHDHQAWYEKGVIYNNRKDYDKAVACFQQALLINSSHFLSHYSLALCYTLQGRLSEAFIAYQSSLLFTTNANAAKRIVGLMQSITTGTDEIVDLYKNKKEANSHPVFDDIDQMVNAKIALNKKYEVNIELKDEAFRQAHLIMEQLKYDAADTNFVMQFYVPLYVDVFKKEQFENCILLMYSGYEYETINEMAKKKSKQIDELKNVVFPYFSRLKSTRVLNFTKRQTAKEIYHYFSDNNGLIVGNSVGEGDEQYYTGDVVVYRKDHTIRTKGREDDKGKKTGLWTNFYSNGNIALKEFYADGESIDTARSYFMNGNVKLMTIRDKKGVAKAEYEYDVNGWLSAVRKVVTENVVEERTYYSNGQLIVAELYENKKLKDGVYKVYYRNGKLKKIVTKKDNTDNGPFSFYYDNGQLNDTCNYVNGKIEGQYLSYYESGKLQSKHNYKNGKVDGESEKYNEDGKLIEKDVWKNSKTTEKNRFTAEGKLYQTLELDDNILYRLRNYNEEGKVTAELEDKRGLHKYNLIYNNGNTSVEVATNDKGVREGKMTYHYSCGAVSEVSVFKDDKLEGMSQTYYLNGKLKSEGTYANDVRDGYQKFYHDNGVLSEEGWYKAGQKQGLWRIYFNNGKLSEERYYLDDQIDGVYRSYNRNGILTNKYCYSTGNLLAKVCYDTAGIMADSVFYKTEPASYTLTYNRSLPRITEVAFGMKNNYLDGAFTTWYINGNVKSQGHYKDQQEDSTSVFYFPDGKLSLKGAYKNGKKTGEWKYYNELGEMTAHDVYTPSRNRSTTRIYTAGEMRIDYSYKNGEKDSAQIYYSSKGKVAFVLFYDEGEFTGYTHEGKDGKLLPQIRVKNGTAKFTAYYADGQKSGEVEIEHNLFKNRFAVYFGNDRIAEERNYNGSGVDGYIKKYNEAGKLIYSAQYKDDNNIGAMETFDNAGNLMISAAYTDDVLNGVTTVIDQNTHSARHYHYLYGQLTSTGK